MDELEIGNTTFKHVDRGVQVFIRDPGTLSLQPLFWVSGYSVGKLGAWLINLNQENLEDERRRNQQYTQTTND